MTHKWSFTVERTMSTPITIDVIAPNFDEATQKLKHIVCQQLHIASNADSLGSRSKLTRVEEISMPEGQSQDIVEKHIYLESDGEVWVHYPDIDKIVLCSPSTPSYQTLAQPDYPEFTLEAIKNEYATHTFTRIA